MRFEMGDFEGCIKECDDAVARGRELHADYALVGRALQRKGNALVKLGKLQEVRSWSVICATVSYTLQHLMKGIVLRGGYSILLHEQHAV